jgi:hypothetical protein
MNITPDQTSSVDIAFILDNVNNYQQLVAAFRPGVEVHVLDAGKDGLDQIAAILDGRSGVGALHIVGHGAPASLNLGTATLDAANAGAYADVLGKIGSALTSGGDILLYGCDVAADAFGARFVGQILAGRRDPRGELRQRGRKKSRYLARATRCRYPGCDAFYEHRQFRPGVHAQRQ